jgi:phospholipid/cholesterol/gamma-HCH transport system substrate-binding protein
MEIRARYVLIGLFVLAVVMGGFGFVYWLNNRGGLGERRVYQIEFDGSISGLSAGSDVLFNGLTVGEVSTLDLVSDNPSKVLATIALDQRTPVRTDTHVGLVFSGLTGTAAIALTGGSAEAPEPTATNGQPPLLVADPAAMKDLTQAARETLGRIDGLIGDNAANLKDAITNIASFSAALGRNAGNVDGIVQGLQRLTGSGKPEVVVTYDLAAPSGFPTSVTPPVTQLVVPAPTSVIALFSQNIIVQGHDGDELPFPEARWADTIPSLTQARIVQGFENAGYMKVATTEDDLTADFKLAIDFREFRITTSPAPPVADVEFSAKLFDADGKMVDAKVFSGTAPVSVTNDSAVAAKALDEAFGKVATGLIEWTLTALTANLPTPAAASP